MTLMSIGEFGQASGLTPKALRLYDELDLLTPAEVDPHTGYRRYATEQLGTARLVALLRLVGMPLSRIRSVLEQPSRDAAAEVAAYWRQVEADTASRRQIVRDLVQRLHEEEPAMTPITQDHETDVGVSHRQGARPDQQDAVVTTADTIAVADGTGDRGEELARLALETHLDRGYDAAVDAVAARDVEDGATTLTALSVVGDEARITHVGDARVHLVRDGGVRRLTSDHTLVAALIEAGDLTEEEARSHPDRLLLNRALAPGAGPEADEVTCRVRAGDRLVVSTDGVHATLPPEELDALVTASGRAQEIADAVAGAVERAGAPDNHTVVVLDLVAAH